MRILTRGTPQPKTPWPPLGEYECDHCFAIFEVEAPSEWAGIKPTRSWSGPDVGNPQRWIEGTCPACHARATLYRVRQVMFGRWTRKVGGTE